MISTRPHHVYSSRTHYRDVIAVRDHLEGRPCQKGVASQPRLHLHHRRVPVDQGLAVSSDVYTPVVSHDGPDVVAWNHVDLIGPVRHVGGDVPRCHAGPSRALTVVRDEYGSVVVENCRRAVWIDD